MKRVLAMLACVGAVMGCTALLRAEGTDNNFTLVNKTGYTLDKVFVSPHDTKEWGEDIMGKDVVPDGESVHITFHPKADASIFDLKVVYKDDNSEVVWQNLELPKINKLTIHYDHKENKTSAETE